MNVEFLRHRMEEARLRLSAGPASPARQEGLRQVERDLAVLGSARGEDLDEVRRRSGQAEAVRQGAGVVGASLGLGAGLAVGGPAGVGLAAAGGLALFFLGRDAGQAAADRWVQPAGVRDVVDRWTSEQPMPPPPRFRQNDLTTLLAEVREQLAGLAEGPDRTAALAMIDRDLRVAGQARGTTLPELQTATRKRERLVKLGGWTGLGVGIALSGALVLRASQGLVDPLTAIRGTILGSGLATVGSWQAGRWLGGKLGDRYQVAGMHDVLERWQPVLEEKARVATSARAEASALLAGGPKAGLAVEPGGLRVGSVLLKVREKRV